MTVTHKDAPDDTYIKVISKIHAELNAGLKAFREK